MSRKVDKNSNPESVVVATTPESPAGGASRGATLTDRQMDVVRLLVEGKTDKQIGAELDISPLTASTHVKQILRKLGVPRRAAVFSAALHRNLLPDRQC